MSALAQSLSYINSGGGTTESGGYNLEYSIGSFQAVNYGSEELEIIRSLFGDEVGMVTGLDEVDVQRIFVYPNPTNGVIQLNSHESVKEISVLNSQMQRIERFQNIPSEINLIQQPAGIYFIGVLSGDRLLFLKVIKE